MSRLFAPLLLQFLLLSLPFTLCAQAEPKEKETADAFDAGEAAYMSGNYARAVEHFTRAIKEGADDPATYGNRASAYSYLGKLDEALKDYDTALKLAIEITGDAKDKRLAYIYYNIAYAYDHAGKIPEALVNYEKSIALDATYPDAHSNTAWILATSPDDKIRNPQKAIRYALAAVDLSESPKARVLDTLAAAYAANGQFDLAVRHQEEAIKAANDPTEKGQYTKRLPLYKAKKPYLEKVQ